MARFATIKAEFVLETAVFFSAVSFPKARMLRNRGIDLRSSVTRLRFGQEEEGVVLVV